MKEAQIVAIHKGGSREEPLNYRPVSLLCILFFFFLYRFFEGKHYVPFGVVQGRPVRGAGRGGFIAPGL